MPSPGLDLISSKPSVQVEHMSAGSWPLLAGSLNPQGHSLCDLLTTLASACCDVSLPKVAPMERRKFAFCPGAPPSAFSCSRAHSLALPWAVVHSLFPDIVSSP